jgi:hypothetical protein
MLQKIKLGSLGHSPQPINTHHGDYTPLKNDPRSEGQPVFRGLVSKGHHAMVKHGIGRGSINRRGG